MEASSTLIFTPRPSRWQVVFFYGLHGLAATAIWLTELDWRVRALLGMAVAISLAYSLRKSSSVTLRCRDDGGMDIQSGENWQAVSVRPDSLVWPWLVVLRYRHENGAIVSLPLPQDSLDSTDFRRLKVWLKWRAVIGEPARKAKKI